MFNRIKKIMPAGMVAVGLIIFSAMKLGQLLLTGDSFNYESLILSEQIQEAAIAVLAECIIGAAIFKFSIKKEKSEDHDSGQKL